MIKRLISFFLAAALICSGAVGLSFDVSAASEGSVSCYVKFSKPAICCDVGDTIDLTGCAVQFDPASPMTTEEIVWSYEGSRVTSFAPSARGVYTLTATAGSSRKTIYVVAKNPEETEYVLYRNDFNTAPSDFRVIEKSQGGSATVSGGAYILNGSSDVNSYVRVLLPSFLDDFGDVKMEASMKITNAVDAKKWGSLMFRVQNNNYPFYQSCLRYDMSVYNGIELSQRNAAYEWEVYETTDFSRWFKDQYNICSVTLKGTTAALSINGYDLLNYDNVAFANGAMGFQTRAAKLSVDYVKITLDGNAPAQTTCDVTYAKPAIRADMGDTIDLTGCGVQFHADAIYTSGNNIIWKKDGVQITSFTPTQAGVTKLTAINGSLTKNVYVVTRNLTDGEYVLYRNDFDTAPTDFRIVQQTNSTVSHDGAGNYVIDASKNSTAYGRVLLPAFLDEFGDMKLEARYKDSNQANERCWSSLMGRVQSTNYPYMQLCIRYNAALSDGVELSQKNEQNQWSVKTKGAYEGKVAGDYNTYALVMQNNRMTGYINGTQVLSYSKSLYVTGCMGLQAKGLKITVDYVKVTLGNTSAKEDTAVSCTVISGRPAIGCNAGQKILLSECNVQFVYGSPVVDGSQVTWKRNGTVITEFTATSAGIHTLTATHGDTTINVYVVAKKSTESEYVLYYNDFSSGTHDLSIAEASNGGTCKVQGGNLVLNGSSNVNAYVRAFLPSYMDDIGDARLVASVKLTGAVDSRKWGSIIFRGQNRNSLYLQHCIRYDPSVSDGLEISQKKTSAGWDVYTTAAYSGWNANAFNEVTIDLYRQSTTIKTNGTSTISYTGTPYSSGSWGFQVRGVTMTVDYVKVLFTNNNRDLGAYTVPGNYADVRDPQTNISVAPSLITDVKTLSDFNNILTESPAVAIMKYEVVDGEGRVVFSDGTVPAETAFHKLGAKVIPAFRIDSNEAADSLASFLIGQDCQDAYAVSATPSVLKRAYEKWKYIRGVVDYTGLTQYDAEDIRYEALENKARVLIMPENTTKETITQLQDAYSCVWLPVSEGKTASVTAINKGPYGIIAPDRSVTEACYRSYYGENTMLRSPVLIGHRGNPSTALENTIVGANAAYGYGADAVENDIYLTTDGVLIVMHDGTIDRTTNGSGSTSSFSSTQLKGYVVDYPANMGTAPIPTLEDYFKQVKGKGQRLVVELKQNTLEQAKPLADLIKKYDILDQMVIITFYYNGTAIQGIRNQLPGIPVGTLGGIDFDDSKPVFMAQKAIELIQGNHTVCNPSYKGLGPASVRELAYRGVTTWPWTLRNQSDFDYMMITGVGGITTDYCQWGTNYVENLTVNNLGQVIATTYGGTKKNVSTSAELVVLEDTLGISFANGVLNVPQTHGDGSATYFFRYKTTTPTGLTYSTVTEVQTAYAGEHRYTAKVTAATCTEGGYTTYTCSCGDSYIDNQVPATGHSSKTTITSATCTTEGSKVIVCTVCSEVTVETIPAAGHNYTWDTCNTCGYVNENYVTPTYYLFGYINGANYACEEDYQNMGTYRFINGQVTASFTEDSYVAVKTGDNGIWYMTNGWQGNEVTAVTLYDNTTFDTANANKLYVPANTYVAFTIRENGDGSLTLSYAPAVCNHQYTCTSRVEPTCTVAGSASYRCDICGSEQTEVLAAAGHSLVWDTCSICGYVDENYAPAEYYLFGYINGADYACEADSNNMGEYRFVDGKLRATFSKVSYVAVKTKGNTAWYMTDGWLGADATEAVLYNSNSLSNTDKLCVPAKVHLLFTLTENADGTLSLSYVVEEDNHSYEAQVFQPTCTRIGYTIFRCICGNSYIGDRVPALGHTYQPQTVAPTCTAAGYTIYTCECGDSYRDDEVPALDHSYEVAVTAATCTAEGRKTYTCTLCADVYYETLPAAGHSHEKIVTPPTCEHDGHTTYICACGDSYTADGVPARGHRYRVAVQPATCARDGKRTTTCLNCGEVNMKVITAMPHQYVWGTCAKCGYVNENYTAPTYYLCGYINGVNHGYQQDYANMGDYRFVDGKLTTIFSEDSYVLVKTEGNGIWYMTNGWAGDSATSAVLYDTTTISGTVADKLLVPANTYVTFTIQENANGTILLSYAPAACDHSYRCVSITDPTCATAGEEIYRCETCWDSYSQAIPAIGHSYDEGICGRCGAEDPSYVGVVQPTVKLRYPTLIFEDEILMNVYYSVENMDDVLSMGMITYDSAVTEWNVDNAQNVIPGYTWSDADGLYYVTTSGIPAKKLGDTIYFAIYAMLSDGTYSYSNLVSYSPKTYLYNRMKTGEANVQSMMAAVLNYGAAAQIYFDYKTEALVNADMTEEQKALIQDYSDTMVDAVKLPDAVKLGEMINNGGYIKRYPTISFEGAFGINYYFQPSAQPVGDVTMYVWDQADYDAVEALSRANATQAITMTLTDTGEYLAMVDGISAKDLDKGVYVSFCYTDGTTDYCSGVVGYSIGLYCKSQAAKTGLLSRLAAATAVYGYYAKQLFG